MNSEFAEMKVRLSVHREKIFRLKKEWESLVESIRRGINPELNDIGNVQMDELDIIWEKMKSIWIEVSTLREKADRLERKLS